MITTVLSLVLALTFLMVVRSQEDVNTVTITTTAAASTASCPTPKYADKLSLSSAAVFLADGKPAAKYKGYICYAALRVCKNTQAPATSGECSYFAATGTVANGATLSYTFEGKIVRTDVTCPGSCVISVRVDTFVNGVLNEGTHTADTSLSYIGSGSAATTIVATGGDGNTYSVPVTANIVCGDDENENEGENEGENENEGK